VVVGDYSGSISIREAARQKEELGSTLGNLVMLSIGLVAGAVAFLPFAFDTSAWDAVTFRVPGNQGNWWHFLAGAPFFLAFPMIWLRIRWLFSARPLAAAALRLIWSLAGLSVIGTILVETPFLLHLAGTSAWQRLAVLSLGFGIMIASAVLLVRHRRCISPVQGCLLGLDTAYLANAALCLVVYSEATGSMGSRSGWLVTMVIVWPMLFELFWLFSEALRTAASQVKAVVT
jgi:hypothetical protein